MEVMGLQNGDIEELRKRQQLLEKLTKVQRSISYGASLQEVFDAITAGAGELFGDEVVGLRLMDEDDPSYVILVSVHGLDPSLEQQLRRTRVDQGAGGIAIRENRLVVIHNYAESPDALQPLAQKGLVAAMAAPVHEQGEVAGSLVIASYQADRSYTDLEQEALLAFAQHTSLALTDAKAVEAMREAQRSKEMFLAMVSHELKSPLTVIMGSLHTLKKHADRLSDEQRKMIIEGAYERAEELAELVARVLEGARAELALHSEEVKLSDLVTGAMRGFENTRALVVGDIPEVLVRVDPTAVKQILGILVENAVAHSPAETGITLDVSIENNQVAVSVQNEGSLPDGPDRDALFVPFKRGNDVDSHGVGLGLYIAAQLAKAIGGKIDADSVDGLVEFCLRFPLVRDGSDLRPKVGSSR
jgi:K+-sensing histidine kinase KdpD